MSASVVTKDLCPESLAESPRNIIRVRRDLVGGEGRHEWCIRQYLASCIEQVIT
jgi:hypothetical protein